MGVDRSGQTRRLAENILEEIRMKKKEMNEILIPKTKINKTIFFCP
jgi:hypothetical protein